MHATQPASSRIRKLLPCFLLLCLLGFTGMAGAQSGFVHTKGKSLVDGSGKPLLLRGTNLGDWLVPEGYMLKFDGGPQSSTQIEALVQTLLGPEESLHFWQRYRANYITRDDIQFIHRAGFNSIRIPFHYKFFAHGNTEGFALIDPVIAWAHEAGLYVILDMHCAPGGQTGANIDDSASYPWIYESKPSQAEFLSIWTRIARHYRTNRTILGYDLLNEPIPAVDTLAPLHSLLEPLYKRATAAVRTVDPNHVIILGGANWDSDFTVFGPPFDKNVMYTFHKYWMPSKTDAIQPFLDFRDKYNVPLWLGESGENTDEWVQDFRQLLEKNQINWAFWPYKKMESGSSPVTFSAPPQWDKITYFAAHGWATDVKHSALRERPTPAEIHAAFDGLLQNIQFTHSKPNPGYLKALGLTTP
ncbi:MAG: glycoside hydrolase family 5 protein [Acidobacteriaceae bacterium]|nr:glycoside hydrolase family 5 protein [Acidobacteriaceae bacterium]